MAVKHQFVSAIADGPDETLVRPSDWNAEHTIEDETITAAMLAPAVQQALLPAGVVLQYGGTAAPSGFLMCDGTSYLRADYAALFSAIGTAFGAADGTHFNVPDMRAKFPRGKGAAETVGATGGAATHTHAAHANLTHSGTAVADHAAHTHSVTSNVAVGDHAAHTHSVTSNVAVGDHASHTHTYTDVPNHTHPHNMQGSTTASTSGTNVMGSTATGGSVRAMAIATSNPSGGVATGTTAGPNATLTHSVTNNAVTSGNPSATLSHSVTNNAVTSGNPSATLTHSVTQPSDHTISAHDSPNSEPPYVIVNYVIKT